MSEVGQKTEGQGKYKIIRGPENQYNPPSKIPYAEVTVYEVGDLLIKRNNWLKGASTWSSAFRKDLPQINQGSNSFPSLDVNDGDGTLKKDTSMYYDNPEMVKLYNQTIAFLTSLGIELPNPDPKYHKMEELMLPYLQKVTQGEKVEVNRGDFVAVWDSSLGNFLVHMGEVDSFGEGVPEIAKIRAARGLNVEESNFTRVKFKGKHFYVSFKHFTPTEQHITEVYRVSDPSDSYPTGSFAFSTMNKEVFKLIKKEADPLAKKG